MRLLMLMQGEGGRLIPSSRRAVGPRGFGRRVLDPLGRCSGQLALGEGPGLPCEGEQVFLVRVGALV